jgi:hypothetical protein
MNVHYRVARRWLETQHGIKIAGWWSMDPMGGDASLDRLHDYEKKTPKEAARLLKSDLSTSRRWVDNYIALGIWDVVMSGPYRPYQEEFKKLSTQVRKTAAICLDEWENNKGRAEKEDWGEENEPEAGRYLEAYLRGKPSGKYKNKDIFEPKGSGPTWYVHSHNDVRLTDYDINVRVHNFWTNDTKTIDESHGADYLEIDNLSVSFELYAGTRSDGPDPQQSILLSASGEDPNNPDEEALYQRQMEIDPETGEFKEDDGWENQNW